jgi:putative ABC transport system substrate-binding protein
LILKPPRAISAERNGISSAREPGGAFPCFGSLPVRNSSPVVTHGAGKSPSRADAVIIAADNLMMENPAVVVSSAVGAGKPTLACDSGSVKAGAVAGVSVNYRQVGELAGQRAVDVLNGRPVGSLPVAVLDSGGIAVNLRAGCQTRVELPKQLIAKAAEVIEPNFRCASDSPH